MEELKSLRQENTKTFDLGATHYRLEAHIGAIHYKDNYADANESWKDIDLTWVNNQILTAPYEVTRNGQQYTFKNKKTGEISTIERTSVFPAGIPLEVVPEYSAVRFRHTLPSANIPFETQFRVTGEVPITRAFDDEGELELETAFVGDILTEKLSQVKDKLTGRVRPAKGQIRVDPTWQVGAASDDICKYWSGSAWVIAATLYVGWHDSSYAKFGSGMRFLNITIPQGATINTAYLTLLADNDRATTGVNSRISAEDVDDAATFSTAADFDTRWAGRTTARVDWDNIAAWTVNTWYDSPSIVSVIQEIVDRALWASGNDMAIFWDDFDDRSTHAAQTRREFKPYESGAGNAPKLVVTYTPFIPKVFIL